MSAKSPWGARDSCTSAKTNVVADAATFSPLTAQDVREAFAVPALVPPILSLNEAAEMVNLRPQTLKRKVSEGLYAKSVVRGKPLRFWRDRLVMEVMQ